MTSRERLLTALENRKPDRLPATTHTLQRYYLDTYEDGASNDQFFDRHGLDPVDWIRPIMPDAAKGQRVSGPDAGGGIVTDQWRIGSEKLEHPDYRALRYTISTPGGDLVMTVQSNAYTSWVSEHLIKNRRDIELIAKYAPAYVCDTEFVRIRAEAFRARGIVRTAVPGFDIYGQPGCWQDAAVLCGIQELIMATYDDPLWVKELLAVLRDRKLVYIRSMKGAPLDLVELGGGDASTTVISPAIFREFVAPYDEPLIAAAHEAGQKIVYHTCGGMMPILEDIAAMSPDAMETFTPAGMGGDADLAEARRRIGDKVCFIGGFDQGEFFMRSTQEQTRQEVLRCFDACGRDGGFIISPSDHFFDARPELITAFGQAAAECTY